MWVKLYRSFAKVGVKYTIYMDVSENSGTPKSSILIFLIGFSIINHPFWSTPIFGNTHMDPMGLILWGKKTARGFGWIFPRSTSAASFGFVATRTLAENLEFQMRHFGIFTYMKTQKNQPNVGKYRIDGCYGFSICFSFFVYGKNTENNTHFKASQVCKGLILGRKLSQDKQPVGVKTAPAFWAFLKKILFSP